MTEESVRVYKSSLELEVNIGSLELHSGGGSPVCMEEDNVLMGTDGEQAVPEEKRETRHIWTLSPMSPMVPINGGYCSFK